MVQGSRSPTNLSTSVLTVTPSEPDIYQSVGDWLKQVLPTGTAIFQGQQNQLAQPIGVYCYMLLITRRRLATNDWSYTATSRIVTEPTEIAIQISIWGDGASEAIHRVHSLWRDFYTTEFMKNDGGFISPLFATDPRQMNFVTAEKQWEDGWSVDLHMQVNFEITIPQQFADTVKVPLAVVDTIVT